MNPPSQAPDEAEVVERLLRASPDDYWQKITAEVGRAGKQVRHAMLLNHEAAHLLAWANIARNAALSPPPVVEEAGIYDREEIAKVLFEQRQSPHDWEDSAEADPESDAGTLRSICFDDADAVIRAITPLGRTAPTPPAGEGAVEDLARRFYEARPATTCLGHTTAAGGLATERLSWHEAQEAAAPYVADLRAFAALAALPSSTGLTVPRDKFREECRKRLDAEIALNALLKATRDEPDRLAEAQARSGKVLENINEAGWLFGLTIPDELRELSEKATAGEWRYRPDRHDDGSVTLYRPTLKG